MKKYFLFIGTVATVIAAPSLVRKHSEKDVENNLALGFANAFAGEPADSCREIMQAVIDGQPKDGAYADKVLDHLHRELYRFNKIETSDVEMVFCRLNKVMGMSPDLTALPQTLTKTDPLGATITATVTAPTESWATAAGYEAKVEVKRDSTVFMTMWWAGNGDSSKGYIIQGNNPMHSDGNTRLRYAQWDRTSADQTLKFFGTQFATSYLTTATGAATSKTGGDAAVYGTMTFNSSTNAITTHQVMIRAGNTAQTASALKCVRTYFTGTLGGTISGYRPAKGVMEDTTVTHTDGTGMDGVKNVTDSVSTTDHSGDPAPGSDLETGTFAKSCNDVFTAGQTGKPFASNTVSYSADPATIF